MILFIHRQKENFVLYPLPWYFFLMKFFSIEIHQSLVSELHYFKTNVYIGLLFLNFDKHSAIFPYNYFMAHVYNIGKYIVYSDSLHSSMCIINTWKTSLAMLFLLPISKVWISGSFVGPQNLYFQEALWLNLKQ